MFAISHYILEISCSPSDVQVHLNTYPAASVADAAGHSSREALLQETLKIRCRAFPAAAACVAVAEKAPLGAAVAVELVDQQIPWHYSCMV